MGISASAMAELAQRIGKSRKILKDSPLLKTVKKPVYSDTPMGELAKRMMKKKAGLLSSRGEAIIKMLKERPIKTITKAIKSEANSYKETFAGKPSNWRWKHNPEGDAIVQALDPKKGKYVGNFKYPHQAEAAFRRMSK